jgi:hypothetical protein
MHARVPLPVTSTQPSPEAHSAALAQPCRHSESGAGSELTATQRLPAPHALDPPRPGAPQSNTEQ